MTSVISVIAVFCWIFLMFSIVKAVVKTIRTFIASRRMGIIKACIQRVGAAVSIVSTCMMVILLCYFCGKVSEARNNASVWEQVKVSEYPEQYMDYLSSILSSSTGTEIIDFDKFADEQISIYQNQVYNYTHICMVVLITAILMFTTFFEKIFYLTESGLLSVVLKEPEEFVVRSGNGKLGVYFRTGPNSSRYLVEFRETPDNLAKLGRFIEWEEEAEADTSAENL